jgi:hypothetical protein
MSGAIVLAPPSAHHIPSTNIRRVLSWAVNSKSMIAAADSKQTLRLRVRLAFALFGGDGELEHGPPRFTRTRVFHGTRYRSRKFISALKNPRNKNLIPKNPHKKFFEIRTVRRRASVQKLYLVTDPHRVANDAAAKRYMGAPHRRTTPITFAETNPQVASLAHHSFVRCRGPRLISLP